MLYATGREKYQRFLRLNLGQLLTAENLEQVNKGGKVVRWAGIAEIGAEQLSYGTVLLAAREIGKSC